MLILLGIAVLLLRAARRFQIPYPAILALSGCLVAALPWAPQVTIEPHLALAIFVAPAVFDTAYELPLRELRRNWLPLTSLAILLIVATTGVVAWIVWALAGLPIFAAIALGAIVSPPDAAASAAVLNQFKLPRRMMVVLQGESLLNDAVALLIFSAALSHSVSGVGAIGHGSTLLLALQVPLGLVLGWAIGLLSLRLIAAISGTLSTIIVEFIITFSTWVIADRLHFSAITAVVVVAMLMAHHLPSRTTSRERITANAVWRSVVFVLNVLAFLLLGLQAKTIIGRLAPDILWKSVGIGFLVLIAVIVVRIAWVLTYGALLRTMRPWLHRKAPEVFVPNRSIGVLISWCGMRGLVTLATAFALPEEFPGRDQIVMIAFIVVLGTIAIQGFSLRSLIAYLNIPKDASEALQIKELCSAMLSAAIATLAAKEGDTADAVRKEYETMQKESASNVYARYQSAHFLLRRSAIQAERKILLEWRQNDRIDDDMYHRMEENLDWAELHVSDPRESDIRET